MRLGRRDPVLPGSLRFVEGLVGRRNELLRPVEVAFDRHSEARRHVDFAAVRKLDRRCLQIGTQATGELRRSDQVGFGREHRKLLAPVAGGKIDLPGAWIAWSGRRAKRLMPTAFGTRESKPR